MPRPEQEGKRNRESIRGLQGVVEQTTEKSGILLSSSGNLVEVLFDFATGEFRLDEETQQPRFFPGIIQAGSRSGWAGADMVGLLISNMVGTLGSEPYFQDSYYSKRKNFPRKSIIRVDRPKQDKYQYILQITNNDPDVPDSTATLRTAEKGLGYPRLTLDERLTIPFAVGEKGNFGVNLPQVIHTLHRVVYDANMQSFFAHNPHEEFDRVFERIGSIKTARRWARGQKKILILLIILFLQ